MADRYIDFTKPAKVAEDVAEIEKAIDSKLLITIPQFSKWAHVHPDDARRMCKNGMIRCFKGSGEAGKWLIPIEHAIQYIDERLVKSYPMLAFARREALERVALLQLETIYSILLASLRKTAKRIPWSETRRIQFGIPQSLFKDRQNAEASLDPTGAGRTGT
jgi:hypothetical protein